MKQTLQLKFMNIDMDEGQEVICKCIEGPTQLTQLHVALSATIALHNVLQTCGTNQGNNKWLSKGQTFPTF